MDRLQHPKLEYYRHVYQGSPLWRGQELDGKTLIIYCEQGFGDIIQFLRYVPCIQGGVIYLHCPKSLHRLVASQGWGVELLDKDCSDLPEHNFHTLTMEIPLIFGGMIPKKSYIKADQMEGVDSGIGICWESGPRGCRDRDFSLKHFKSLSDLGRLYSLQHTIHNGLLLEDCDGMEVRTVELDDFQDTAELISSLDFVVSVDTAVLHLAGAMGVRTFGILCEHPDARWGLEWYPSVRLLRAEWSRRDDIFDKLLDEAFT